ncbi:MAG TPA: hypothetical protein VNI83_14740 [Vicinamibacterales bacterium]|nr:hypothetical protein [Vicinamibacterales bacterium]
MSWRARLVWLWIIVGVAVWNLVFDLLVSRGVKEYLRWQAEHELGRRGPVDLRALMDRTAADAALAATFWALLVVSAGLLTIRLAARRSCTR